jgi:hypothetical protein
VALAPLPSRAQFLNVIESVFRADFHMSKPANRGENTQAIAAHESPRTTKLYDRTGDENSPIISLPRSAGFSDFSTIRLFARREKGIDIQEQRSTASVTY